VPPRLLAIPRAATSGSTWKGARHEARRSHGARHRRHRRNRPRDRAGARGARSEARPHRPASRGARAPRARARRPGVRGRPRRPPRARPPDREDGRHRAPGRERGVAGERSDRRVRREPDRCGARRQPAGADPPRAEPGAADDRAPRRTPRLHQLPLRQGRGPAFLALQRDEVRPSRLRPVPSPGPARHRGRRLDHLSRLRSAGMFAKSGARLPRGGGTRSPQQVAAAVVRAVERTRARSTSPLSASGSAPWWVVSPRPSPRPCSAGSAPSGSPRRSCAGSAARADRAGAQGRSRENVAMVPGIWGI
jgi:hypothetical protein